MTCTEEQRQTCQYEKLSCEGCYYNKESQNKPK